MSYNISDSVMSHLKTLQAEVDVGSFGPTQKRKLYNYASSGIIKGGGVPALIAKTMRLNKKMPYLAIRSGSVSGRFIKNSDVHSKILGALAMVKIQNEGIYGDPYIAANLSQTGRRRFESPEQFLEYKPEEFYVYQTNIGNYFHYKSLDFMEVNLNDPIVINLKESQHA